ncbi:rho gtpase-activating protein 15 [Limosa lapponica baueri]|uniref:Rho gtpase-activating protein 15 n=1 Tax=Limosa lapponica baueri TaxID=1758121 RepID=A0A2I0U0M7_LIMLA|nr:rho gtpase-activating protein 15 [Limosa lapponica baueri]
MSSSVYFTHGNTETLHSEILLETNQKRCFTLLFGEEKFYSTPGEVSMGALHVQYALQQKNEISDCNKMHFNFAVFSHDYVEHFHVYFASDLIVVNLVTMERSTTSDTASEKPNPSHHCTGAVQMRIKNANSHHDRLSQSKSMILSENIKVAEPVNRHRRNHSQHNLTLADIITTQDHTAVQKEGYLLKAKIADGGKKLRKNWSTSWIVLTARKMEFYKESKQPALANLKPGYKPECVDLCGARIEWTSEKSSRKNVFQTESYKKIMPDGKSERGEGFGISSGDILGKERTERDWCYMSR